MEIVKKPKLAMFDIDGTLVNSRHAISSEVLAGINRLKTANIECGLATGRALAGAKPVLSKLEISASSVLFAGALIYDPVSQSSIYEALLPKDATKSITNLCAKNKWYVELYSYDQIYTSQHHKFTDIHLEYQYQEPLYKDDNDVIENYKLLKLVIVTDGQEQYEEVMQLADLYSELRFSPAPGAAHPGIMFINVTSKAGSRYNAFKQLLEVNQVDPKEVICFGDAEGDRVFIESAGLGIAMGNAPDSVKAAADYVTDHVDENGVAKAIDLILEKINE